MPHRWTDIRWHRCSVAELESLLIELDASRAARELTAWQWLRLTCRAYLELRRRTFPIR